MNNIEKIFAQIDRISRKLDYIQRSLEVFDPPADDGQNSEEPQT